MASILNINARLALTKWWNDTGGGLKVNFPLRTLNKFKSFLLSFLRPLSQSLYFLHEDIHDWSMLTNFEEILLKNGFLKKSQNFEFSKN